jgi:hypothetical protein
VRVCLAAPQCNTRLQLLRLEEYHRRREIVRLRRTRALAKRASEAGFTRDERRRRLLARAQRAGGVDGEAAAPVEYVDGEVVDQYGVVKHAGVAAPRVASELEKALAGRKRRRRRRRRRWERELKAWEMDSRFTVCVVRHAKLCFAVVGRCVMSQRGPRPRSARTEDSSSESPSPDPAAIEEHLRVVDDEIGGFASSEPALVSAEVRFGRTRCHPRCDDCILQLAFSKYVDTFVVRPKGTAYVPSLAPFSAVLAARSASDDKDDVTDGALSARLSRLISCVCCRRCR